MLRISVAIKGPSEITLKLEGRIVSEWVWLLKEECLRCLKGNKTVWLDFSDVTFVDDHGAEMLKDLAHDGVRLMNCSPLIESLLQDDEGKNK